MMNKTITTLSIFALLVVTLICSPTAFSQTVKLQNAPAALVADLYKQHDAQKGPFFQTKNRAVVDKYFTKSTADLIWKDALEANGEVGAIDADPLYAAQDTDIKRFVIGGGSISGTKALVPVSFENFGEKQTINYALALEKGKWKIEDIKYTEGTSLVETYRAAFAADSGASETTGKKANSEPDVFGYFYIKGKTPAGFADISEISLGGSGEYGAQANPPYYGLIRLKNKAKTDFALLKPIISGKNIRFKTKEVGDISYNFDGTLLRTDYTGGDPDTDEVAMKGTFSKMKSGRSIAQSQVEFTWSNGD